MKSCRKEQLSKCKNNPPLVSIGIPTYNSDKRIGSTLTAILNQDYPNLEIIISDNYSSDNTESVCAQFCRRSPAIHYFRQTENIGIIPNFDFVLRKATGDFFMWVADDDSLEPGTLERYVNFLISNSGYSLVSGEIRYWSDKRAVFDENHFSIEHALPDLRVVRYYSKVKHGAIFYGLMPIEIARQINLENRMGEDWHVVAKVAYLGKIKMLNGIGYHKRLNGSSKTLKNYAKIIGAPWFTTSFPHAQIALDAFSEIMRSPFYGEKTLVARLTLALNSFACIIFHHYCTEFPFIIGGKIKRLFGVKKKLRALPSSLKKEWAS